MVRKELHLDSKVIRILEKEAKKQKRSLKNYLENLVIQQANRLELPSKEYMEIMDKTLNKLEKGQLQFSSLEEVIQRNEISG